MRGIRHISMAVMLLATLVALVPSRTVQAAGAVGDGTPGSCTEAALNTAVSGGGLVTFDCGANPVTIFLTSELELQSDTWIDGGGSVTLDGQDLIRILYVNSGVTLTVENITLSNGKGGSGGGIVNNSGTVILIDSTISSSSADVDGGGIYNNGGTVTLTNSTLTGNTAGNLGGGVHNDGTLTITNSTLTGNMTGVSGGGISNLAIATITNSTLSGNTAAIDGGGIFNNNSLTITNSTLNGNRANSSAGGGIFNYLVTADLRATIIANSLSSSNCTGNFISLGENLDDDGTCNLIAAGDLPNTNPLLEPLQDNGGPTLTHLPGSGSPAIDAAACLSSEDQRGFARPEGPTCDIGSVEVSQSPTYPLCANYYTGAVTSPLSGGCGTGTVELTELGGQSFCINPWTGQLQYSFGRACMPPRIEHTLPDDGDLLTCVSYYTGANRWVRNHSQCTPYEAPNTIPSAP